MSNAGVFQIVTNDGKQDRMLMATQLLKRRLEIVEAARARDPMIADKTPTLLDIEKTHILFMNASFKPFAAIGFEYQKVIPSGQAAYGNRTKFSLPMFGDFIGDMVLHVTLAAPTITRDSTYDVSDANRGSAAAFRWCHFPGERLLQQVRFTVAGNELDSYTFHSVNMYREVMLPTRKRDGWFRGVGQELPKEGWLAQPGIGDVTTASGDLSTAIMNGGTTDTVSGPSSHRINVGLFNGAQTPSASSSSLDLWIPLLFWFNLDPRLILPSVALPNTNRDVEFTFATSDKMYGLVPRGAGTYNTPYATVTDATDPFTACELYVNNLFVQPEVHDIFIRRIGFTLVRVHREHTEQVVTNADSKLLSNLKWPVEAMFIGLRVASYETSARDINKWHYFSKATNTSYNSGTLLKGSSAGTPLTGTTVTVTTGGAMTLASGSLTLQAQAGDTISIAGYICQIKTISSNTAATVVPAPTTAIYGTPAYAPVMKLDTVPVIIPELARTVDTMGIEAHGVKLYDSYSSKFYSDYLPLRYGGENINVSKDVGVMSVFFCLYPGAYQPSGHINVSRAREFYLKYTSSVISSSVPGTLVVVASALNFLLISDGSAVLRYTT